MQDSTKDPSQAAEWPEWLEALASLSSENLGPLWAGATYDRPKKITLLYLKQKSNSASLRQYDDILWMWKGGNERPWQETHVKGIQIQQKPPEQKGRKTLSTLCSLHQHSESSNTIQETSWNFQTFPNCSQKEKVMPPASGRLRHDLWLVTWHDLTWLDMAQGSVYGSVWLHIIQRCSHLVWHFSVLAFGCFWMFCRVNATIGTKAGSRHLKLWWNLCPTSLPQILFSLLPSFTNRSKDDCCQAEQKSKAVRCLAGLEDARRYKKILETSWNLDSFAGCKQVGT